MKVVFASEVEEDLYELIEVLIEKEYLGTYSFAISYVEDLISDIQQNINSKLKKKAPAFFERYGKDVERRVAIHSDRGFLFVDRFPHNCGKNTQNRKILFIHCLFKWLIYS
ncbi:MAG: hypothetical protein LUH50_14845 [Bacteroides intestinalis]|nr:hypothetical protein [Bacteroides intestinalis]